MSNFREFTDIYGMTLINMDNVSMMRLLENAHDEGGCSVGLMFRCDAKDLYSKTYPTVDIAMDEMIYLSN